MINLIKDIKILLEDFKFQSRGLKGRDEERKNVENIRLEKNINRIKEIYNSGFNIIKTNFDRTDWTEECNSGFDKEDHDFTNVTVNLSFLNNKFIFNNVHLIIISPEKIASKLIKEDPLFYRITIDWDKSIYLFKTFPSFLSVPYKVVRERLRKELEYQYGPVKIEFNQGDRLRLKAKISTSNFKIKSAEDFIKTESIKKKEYFGIQDDASIVTNKSQYGPGKENFLSLNINLLNSRLLENLIKRKEG